MSRSYADMITTALRNESQPSPRFPNDRERLVQVVERGLRMRRRRQQMVRWTMTASAAAAALVLVIGGKTLLNPYKPVPIATVAEGPRLRIISTPQHPSGMMVGTDAAPVPVVEGMALPQGFRLVAPPAGEVRFAAVNGTTLTLEGGGEVAVKDESNTQRYELKEGAIRAKVAKLVTGERFIIATADAEIEVHGTAFRVAVVPVDPACGGGTITRVAVTEGVVSVRRAAAPRCGSRRGTCGRRSAKRRRWRLRPGLRAQARGSTFVAVGLGPMRCTPPHRPSPRLRPKRRLRPRRRARQLRRRLR